MLANEIRLVWNAAHKEIKKECGKNDKKLALAELIGLRQIARQLLTARAALSETK